MELAQRVGERPLGRHGPAKLLLLGEALGAEGVGQPTTAALHQPGDPACFWRADVEEAADRLARILREERADVLTIYDPHGNYGHPDHVQVHRVGRRAGELAGVLTTAVDVTGYLEVKRAAMAAHRSQIGETSFFLSMGPSAFAAAFGTEWYRRLGIPPGLSESGLFGEEGPGGLSVQVQSSGPERGDGQGQETVT